MTPEDYQHSLSEGLGQAGDLIGLLLPIFAIPFVCGLLFWLFYVRGLSVGDLLNLLLASGQTVVQNSPDLARSALASPVLAFVSAPLLAYGSIPVAVLVVSLDPRGGLPADPRGWMVSPRAARKMLLRS
jgi:hypothetical protein